MDDPTFLLCSERSGSNLIRAILDAHPEIFSPMPLHLGFKINRALHCYGHLTDDASWSRMIRDVASGYASNDWGFELIEQELEQNVTERSFKALYSYVYRKGLEHSGKKYVFIKENSIYEYFLFLLNAFPRARFVYQVRDPRDYLLSCKKMFHRWVLYGSQQNAIDVWRKDQLGSLRALYTLGPERVFVQRYEDLVADPERVLGALCPFLGVTYDPVMLDFWEREESQKAADRGPAGWKNLAKPIMSKNTKKYREGLRWTELAAVEAKLGNLMDQLGYERYVPSDWRRRAGVRLFDLGTRVTAMKRRLGIAKAPKSLFSTLEPATPPVMAYRY